MKELLYNELSDLDLRLIMEAEKARENAYNPFSNFYVGAALLARDGTIIPGANVENSSYGLTLCAERSAMAAANAQGIKIFNKMVISTRGATFDVEEPSMSCGACRQWLYEFSQVSGIDLELIYVIQHIALSSFTLKEQIAPIREAYTCLIKNVRGLFIAKPFD